MERTSAASSASDLDIVIGIGIGVGVWSEMGYVAVGPSAVLVDDWVVAPTLETRPDTVLRGRGRVRLEFQG